MGYPLRQSTAATVKFGPFLDPTDAKTPVTGLVSALDNGTTGIKLSKNGGALTIRHATVTATTYDAYGFYTVTLDTTDTNTLGTVEMAFSDPSTNLPVWLYCDVHPAAVFDALYASSGGAMPVDVKKWLSVDVLGMGAANGPLINGTNSGSISLSNIIIGSGTLGLTTITVSGSVAITGALTVAAGVTFSNSTTNGNGLTISGNGTGSGIKASGGATGHGSWFVGGATSGSGINITNISGIAFSVNGNLLVTNAFDIVGDTDSALGLISLGADYHNNGWVSVTVEGFTSAGSMTLGSVVDGTLTAAHGAGAWGGSGDTASTASILSIVSSPTYGNAAIKTAVDGLTPSTPTDVEVNVDDLRTT